MSPEITQVIVTAAIAAGVVLKWYTKYEACLTSRAHNSAFVLVAMSALSLANTLVPLVKVEDYASVTTLVVACVLMGWGAGDGAFNLAGGNDSVPEKASQPKQPGTSDLPELPVAVELKQPG